MCLRAADTNPLCEKSGAEKRIIMTQEMQFKKIVAQYCNVAPEEMTDEMRFREDLGFSSLDFMSFLGELEDTFDIELEQEDVVGVLTIAEALELLDDFEQEA